MFRLTSNLSREAFTLQCLRRSGLRCGKFHPDTNVRSISNVASTHNRHDSSKSKEHAKEDARRQFYAPEESEVEQWVHETNEIVRSDVGSFSPTDWKSALAVLDNWTWTRQENGTAMAFELFNRLADEEEARNIADPILTKEHLRHVVGSWCELPMGLTALQVVKMLEKYRVQVPNLYPDDITYNLLIKGAMQQGESPLFAEKVLRMMLNIRANDPKACCPTTETYNSVISAWAKSGHKEAPEKSEALLFEMEALSEDESLELPLYSDHTSYSIVISTWTKSGRPDAVDRATGLMARLKGKIKAGKKNLWPNTIVYNTLFQTMVAANRVEEADAMLREFCDESISWMALATPDNYSFSIVLSGWAASPDPDAAMKAEALFQRMKDLHKDISLTPNTITLNALMTVWAKSRQEKSVEMVEYYLALMKESSDCQPTTRSYNVVISALANSRKFGAADKAEKLLLEMKSSTNPSCKPDLTSFNAVINAWATSKYKFANRKAFEMFHAMNGYAEADVITYTTLLKCLATSTWEHKAQKAWSLHEEMEAASIAPTIRTMNEVMAACAFSNRQPYEQSIRDNAFVIATKMLQKILTEVKPSTHTFSFFFLAAPKSGKEADIAIAYEICRRLGMDQNPQVMRGLEHAAPHLIQRE